MGIGTIRRDDPLLRVALPASLAIHLAIAALIPALAVVHGDGPAIETISFVRIIRQTSVVVRPVAREHEAAAPKRAAVPDVAKITPAPAKRDVYRAPVQATRSQARSAAPMVAAARQGGSVEAAGASAMPAASPPPQQASLASTQSKSDEGGYMPLGADQPDPVLDPTVQQRLAQLGVRVTLVITVDERGHTKDVVFQPPLDDAMEARIRSMLASASWDPAVCGAGIPCEGTTTIKL